MNVGHTGLGMDRQGSTGKQYAKDRCSHLILVTQETFNRRHGLIGDPRIASPAWAFFPENQKVKGAEEEIFSPGFCLNPDALTMKGAGIWDHA